MPTQIEIEHAQKDGVKGKDEKFLWWIQYCYHDPYKTNQLFTNIPIQTYVLSLKQNFEGRPTFTHHIWANNQELTLVPPTADSSWVATERFNRNQPDPHKEGGWFRETHN